MQTEADQSLTALRCAKDAMDTWCASYAPELMNKDDVAEATQRLSQHGTISYIAEVTNILDEAIKAIEPKPQQNFGSSGGSSC